MRDGEARSQQPANNFELTFVEACQQIEPLHELVCIKTDIEMRTANKRSCSERVAL